jgi:pullulanase
VVAFRLKDLRGIDDWQQIIVILNASQTPQRITVPQDTYTVVCENGRIDEQGLGTRHGTEVTVLPQSALIMHH